MRSAYSELLEMQLIQTLSASEFAFLSHLMNWSCQQITFGWQPEPVRHNGTAQDILRLSGQGKRFVCGTFQRLFAQLAQQAGFAVREVTIVRRHTEQVSPTDPWAWFSRHQVVEVNLTSRLPKQFGADSDWTLFDPTNNLTYGNGRRYGLSVSEVLAACQHGTPPLARLGAYRPAEVPDGPAWRSAGGRWQVVLTPEQLNDLFQILNRDGHTAYYDGYAVWQEGDRRRAWSPDPDYHPTEHWNQPLESFFGGPVHWLLDWSDSTHS